MKNHSELVRNIVGQEEKGVRLVKVVEESDVQ